MLLVFIVLLTYVVFQSLLIKCYQWGYGLKSSITAPGKNVIARKKSFQLVVAELCFPVLTPSQIKYDPVAATPHPSNALPPPNKSFNKLGGQVERRIIPHHRYFHIQSIYLGRGLTVFAYPLGLTYPIITPPPPHSGMDRPGAHRPKDASFKGCIVQEKHCPMDASSKRRIVKGTHRPREASSKRRIVQGIVLGMHHPGGASFQGSAKGRIVQGIAQGMHRLRDALSKECIVQGISKGCIF